MSCHIVTACYRGLHVEVALRSGNQSHRKDELHNPIGRLAAKEIFRALDDHCVHGGQEFGLEYAVRGVGASWPQMIERQGHAFDSDLKT